MNTKYGKFYILSLITIILFTGCGKTTCSYCGESKFCEEYNILGTTRNICDDCLGNSQASISSNVTSEYESDLIDKTVSTNTASDFTDIANNDMAVSNNTPVTDIYSSDVHDIAPMDVASSTPTTASSKDEIVSAAAASLSTYNYYIQPGSDDNTYNLFYESNDANITLVFSNNGNTLTISMYEGAVEDDFSNACINCTLAFLGSTDYENKGYNVFNNAKAHGNFNEDNCRFLYMEGAVSANDTSGVKATYEISRQ